MSRGDKSGRAMFEVVVAVHGDVRGGMVALRDIGAAAVCIVLQPAREHQRVRSWLMVTPPRNQRYAMKPRDQWKVVCQAWGDRVEI